MCHPLPNIKHARTHARGRGLADALVEVLRAHFAGEERRDPLDEAHHRGLLLAGGHVGVIDRGVVQLRVGGMHYQCIYAIGSILRQRLTSPQVPRPSVSLSSGQLAIRQASSLAARRKLVFCVSDILPAWLKGWRGQRTNPRARWISTTSAHRSSWRPARGSGCSRGSGTRAPRNLPGRRPGPWT